MRACSIPLAALLIACATPAARPDAAPSFTAAPPYTDVHAAVSDASLIAQLQAMAFERSSPEGKARFRDLWTARMQALGLEVTPLDYDGGALIAVGGRDLEAVLPGRSPDSIVIIVHYDSVGPDADPTGNPGVDDDMTGMSIQLETARVLAPYRGRLQHTVRFVASDQEETGTLAGARAYATYLRAKATAEHFAIVAAIDDEQSGWSCAAEQRCGDDPPGPPVFDIDSCDGTGQYDSHELGDRFEAVAGAFASIGVRRNCLGAASDHYAMWEIGVPSVVVIEHVPAANPHFDRLGGDTFDTIDQAYFTSIARPAVTFAAVVVGIDP